MKTVFKLTGITTIALMNSSQALERLTPINEPKIVASESSKKAPAKAWLGLAGQPVNAALAAQLGIDHGVTIELIAPDGSAGKAGIKRFDVITKLGDTPIKSMQDLRSVMKKSAVNDTLSIEIFSGGKLQTHQVVLDAHPGNFAKSRVGRPRVRVVPQNSLVQPQKLPKSFRLPPEMDREQMEKVMEAQLKQMEQQIAQMQMDSADFQAMKMKLDGAGVSSQSTFSSSVTVMDKEGSIHLKNSGKSGKHVEVKDKDGKVLYAGAYQTEEDKKKVPAKLRARIDALGLESSGGGFDFSFGH